MNTSLTTFDGFPRDDIDVAQSTSTLSTGIFRDLWRVGRQVLSSPHDKSSNYTIAKRSQRVDAEMRGGTTCISCLNARRKP